MESQQLVTRFVVLIVVLSVGSATVADAAILYGRAHPEPNRLHALGFDVCEGRPCFMGIIAHVSSWNDAQLRLKKHASESYTNVIEVKLDTLTTEVWRAGSTEETVSYMSMYDDSGKTLPSLGHFVAEFGDPCGVAVAGDKDNPHIDILFPYMSLRLIRPVGSGLNLYSAVENVYVGLNHNDSIAHYDRCVVWQNIRKEYVPWIGFGSLEAYYVAIQRERDTIWFSP